MRSSSLQCLLALIQISQFGAQLADRARHVRFHGSNLEPQDLSDLLQAAVLVVTQDEDRPLPRGEAVERGREAPRDVPGDQRVLRARSPVGRKTEDRLLVLTAGAPPPELPAPRA